MKHLGTKISLRLYTTYLGGKRRTVHEEKKLRSRNRKYGYEHYVGMKPKNIYLNVMIWFHNGFLSWEMALKYLQQSQNLLPEIFTNVA